MTSPSKNEVLHQLHSLNRYKPKAIVSEKIKDTRFKPRKGMSAFNLLREVALSGETDNPYVEEHFLAGSSLYFSVQYAIKVKRKRWPELEKSIVKIFYANTANRSTFVIGSPSFQYVADYIVFLGITIDDWPELKKAITEDLLKLRMGVEATAALMLNYEKNNPQYNEMFIASFAFKYTERGTWAELARITKTSEETTELATELMIKVLEQVYGINSNSPVPQDRNILNVKEAALDVYLKISNKHSQYADKLAISLIKEYLNESTRLHELIETTELYDVWDMAFHLGGRWACENSWQMQANYWKLRDLTEFNNVVSCYGKNAPVLLFIIYTKLGKPMPKILEEEAINTKLLTLTLAGRASRPDGSVRLTSRFIWSLFDTVLRYIDEAKKNRVIGFEQILLCDEVWEGLTEKTREKMVKTYASRVKKWAKTGIKIDKH